MDKSVWLSAQSGKQINAHANIAGMALLIYDYYLTIDQEVNLVWARRWSFGQVIYMLARYLPFPAIALTVARVLETVNNEPCPNLDLSNALHMASVVFAEALLILRTMAFWDRTRQIVLTLSVLAVICLGGAIGITDYVTSKVPDMPTLPTDECPFKFNRGGSIVYAFLMLHELVLLSLISYRWFSYHRYARSKIIVVSYIDAVAYIFAMLSLSVACVLDITVEPSYHNDYFDNIQVVGHSIFCSRTYFHLRKTAEYQSRRSITETPFDDLTVAVELSSMVEYSESRNRRSIMTLQH
ncbi:hypothetical protein CONPUDRAFT_143354 [Coniophora puteana RWD-64-598 SS2]|uniref:DUF6533 domain-containing protein n=1 Tax=Coniophora puteana (strain RWD-64-598) TaxID=741705 RepID=A0A5M3MWU8_CONPW|nr:uncharacterized protein CONPUDRAFT_143354 [Coniophora puteana RWD-64-598 SS2]EIW83467.1 hypothetical protein CONPUDRAFT_143354 [Coniophora puteana RWD-64-598 SS2]